jgi:DNA polymerase (family X)
MPTNAEAAELFRQIGDLLDIQGERFKPEAYRRASRSIESLTEDINAVAARDELRTIPGVGEAIEEKLKEFLKTGRLEYFEKLRAGIPPGILTLLAVPGLGPKTAARFWKEFHIEGPDELTAAIEAGRLNGVAGFGPKKIEQIRAAVAAAKGGSAGAGRRPLEAAYPTATRLLRRLSAVPGVEQIEIAGSFRRCRETVGDLDILATSKEPESVFDVFSGLSDVGEVRMRGPTKETVVLKDGLQVDLRVVEPDAFGAALLYFTGSKDHNVRLRSIARDRGLKINEYGIFRGEERLGGRTEEEVYRVLHLAWVPPELRENRGEIEAAEKGPLPPLVESKDLRGELHAHLPPRPSVTDVDRLIAAAKERKLAYLVCVVGGVDSDGKEFSLPEVVRAKLSSADSTALRVAPAVEVGLGGVPTALAKLSAPYAIVRPTKELPVPSAAAAAKRTTAAVVAHVGGEEGARRWVPWAKSVGAAIEVGPGSERLDSTGARIAREGGVALVVPTGIAQAEDDPTSAVGLGFARRAAAQARDVRNAAPATELIRAGGAKRRG